MAANECSVLSAVRPPGRWSGRPRGVLSRSPAEPARRTPTAQVSGVEIPDPTRRNDDLVVRSCASAGTRPPAKLGLATPAGSEFSEGVVAGHSIGSPTAAGSCTRST